MTSHGGLMMKSRQEIKLSKSMDKPTGEQGIGLYIHVPFCVSKCVYCDFLSFEGMGACTHELYVHALIEEMRSVNADITNEHCITNIDTVYIGGGTPTALSSSLLCVILQEVQQFSLSSDVEITLEMNPVTNPLAVLADYTRHGVNRLSIGLQAWQDEFLRGLRRAHTSAEFTQTMRAAHAAGIDNINVDLMFGLPWQSLWHWSESIAQVVAHSPTHISTYSLTPAENTPLWDALEARQIALPSESTDRDMYYEAVKMLTAAGYEHYELSNFALPGLESRHNVDCWLRKPYLGLGLGAHSFDGVRRWCNTSDMGLYLDVWGTEGKNGRDFARVDMKALSQRDAMAETMFLGLRMTKGVNLQTFYQRFDQHLYDCYGQELEMLTAKGLIACTTERVALTPLGMDLANQVFEAFL